MQSIKLLLISNFKIFLIFLKKVLTFQKQSGIISKSSGNDDKRQETTTKLNKNQVGIDCDEGPPVPIPNTEVKLVHVDNTRLATARDDRFLPTLILSWY